VKSVLKIGILVQTLCKSWIYRGFFVFILLLYILPSEIIILNFNHTIHIDFNMKNLLSILCIALTINCIAQNNETLYEPFSPSLRLEYSDNLPTWVKMTFDKNVNFYAVKKAFEDAEKEKKEEKSTLNTEGVAQNKQTEVGEDKYETYFERWQRAYLPFVQEDGSIKLPTTRQYYNRTVQENKENVARTTLRSGPANWVNIGPKETHFLRDNVDAQPPCPWQTNVFAFDIATSDPNILYCTTETGSIFKTNDKGQNWTVCGNSINFGGAGTAIEIHPTNPNIVYAGFNAFMYKTTDGGATWDATFLDGLEIHDIAIMPNNPDIVLVAADRGLYRSTNGGQNWTQLYSTTCFDIEVNPINKTDVYILKSNGTNVEFLKSTDEGASFFAKNIGLTVGRSGRLAVTKADVGRVYALILTPTIPVLLKSTTGGDNWTTMNPTFCTAGINDATGGQGFYDLSLAVSQTNADQILFGICSTYKSTDGGATSTFLSGYCGAFQLHPDVQEIKTIGNDAWVATDGGLTLSTDFYTLTSSAFARNNGIYSTDFWGFSQGWNEDIMVGGRYHNGNTAMAEFYPAGKALRMGGAEAGTGYVLHGRTRAAVFSDLGDGWILPDKFDNRSTGRFPFTKYPTEDGYGFDASELVIDPLYYRTNYLGRDTVLWRTTDGGSSFISLAIFPTKIRRIELSRSNAKVLYLTTDGGLYRSTDRGTTFTRQTLPTGRSGFHAEISLSPVDDNVLWMAFRNIAGNNLGKVYKSTDAGLTWTDMTTATLNGLQIKWVVFTGNTEGGVYIAAHENKGRVLYRDDTFNDWQDFSNNLPASMNIIRLLPFYRDGKLRVAGNRGIWETPMFNTTFKPIVQPTVDKQISNCLRDTFFFDDYSIVNHANTKWQWSFSPAPAYVSSATVRNPKVVFDKAGNFSVTMTLTDGNGNVATKTYTDFVTVGDACGASPLAGNALELKATTDYARTPAPNVTTNTLTLMAWIKPNGTQVDFASILMSSSGISCGMNFMNGNRLGYHWQDNVNTYTFVGGPIVPANEWSHVALVIAPDSAVLYLNGVPYKRTGTHPVTAFTVGFNIGNDRNNVARTYKGLIDEVLIYNKTLKTNEVRELMHLTRNPATETGLLGYYQMNETAGEILDKVGIRHATLVGAPVRTLSTAPVGNGTSFRLNVNSGGAKVFTNTGVTMTFPNTGTIPNGDIVVTRLNNQPDQKPSTNPTAASYWIINNFGTATGLSPLASIAFEGYGNITATEANAPTVFKLYKRASTADGNTWATSIAAAATASAGANGVINYTNTVDIPTAGQFVISKEGSTAIQSPKGDIEVQVFPNPVGQNSVLHIQTNKDIVWDVFLYDVSGRVIKKERFNKQGTVSLANIAKGVYLYQLISKEAMVFDRVVVE
jgi:photosystem II stability/assembly factor-like uncharacterized protein